MRDLQRSKGTSEMKEEVTTTLGLTKTLFTAETAVSFERQFRNCNTCFDQKEKPHMILLKQDKIGLSRTKTNELIRCFSCRLRDDDPERLFHLLTLPTKDEKFSDTRTLIICDHCLCYQYGYHNHKTTEVTNAVPYDLLGFVTVGWVWMCLLIRFQRKIIVGNAVRSIF